MISSRTVLTVLFLLSFSVSRAQDQHPFIFSLTGGLFFPSNVQFKEIYQSSSDLIWGVGICLPVQGPLGVAGDMSFFRSEGHFPSFYDSSAEIQQKFIHLGVINKQPVSRNLFLRMSGGINFVTVRQSAFSSRLPTQTAESGRKFGYFAGLGAEQFLDESGHLAMFFDVLYDYCRLHDAEFSGDFGGLRVVLGINLIMF